MSIQSEREAKIAAARLKAAVRLKRKLEHLTIEQLPLHLHNDPKYLPGDMDDDLIELCSIIASIRYFQEDMK